MRHRVTIDSRIHASLIDWQSGRWLAQKWWRVRKDRQLMLRLVKVQHLRDSMNHLSGLMLHVKQEGIRLILMKDCCLLVVHLIHQIGLDHLAKALRLLYHAKLLLDHTDLALGHAQLMIEAHWRLQTRIDFVTILALLLLILVLEQILLL